MANQIFQADTVILLFSYGNWIKSWYHSDVILFSGIFYSIALWLQRGK